MIKRFACLLCLPILAVACDPGPSSDPVVPRPRDPAEAESNKQEPVSPATGIVRIQEAHDLYKVEVSSIEKALGEKGTPTGNQARTLRQILVAIAHLKTATELGRDNQDRENARNTHGMMLQEQTGLLKKRRQLWVEITEIEQYLTEIEKGTGSPPEGFTEPELKDRLTDALARDKKLKEELGVLREKMTALETRINAGDFGTSERSLFADELTGLEELEKRINVLLERTS
jgi:hypothetical protein